MVTWIAALQLMLDLGHDREWFQNSFIVTLAVVAAFGFAFFCAWEATKAQPAVELRVFRHRGFVAAVIALALSLDQIRSQVGQLVHGGGDRACDEPRLPRVRRDLRLRGRGDLDRSASATNGKVLPLMAHLKGAVQSCFTLLIDNRLRNIATKQVHEDAFCSENARRVTDSVANNLAFPGGALHPPSVSSPMTISIL